VPSATDGRENAGVGCDSDRSLDIPHIGAACDQAGLLGDHAVPNRPTVFVPGIAGAQKIAFELTSK
jgi:hypothetical protein